MSEERYGAGYGFSHSRKRRNKEAKREQFLTIVFICLLPAVLILAGMNIRNFIRLKQCQSEIAKLEAAETKRLNDEKRDISQHQVKYRDYIEYYSNINGVDPAFTAAIIKRESNYDPKAVSVVYARGLMQILQDTGEWLAPKVDIDSFDVSMLFDAETNIKMGCWYLGYLSRMFDGDPILIACAYHAGQNNVKNWVKKYSRDGIHLTINDIPTDDTRYYAGKVIHSYAVYQQYYYTD